MSVSVKEPESPLPRRVLQRVGNRRTTKGTHHLRRAAELIADAEKSLRRSQADLGRVVAAGDFRRGHEVVRDLTLVAETPRREQSGQKLKLGDLTVYFTDAKRFGITLLLATGSQQHLAELRDAAKARGLTLTEAGVSRGSEVIASMLEGDIYGVLGLQFIEPELREGRGEIALARTRRIPIVVPEQAGRNILDTEALDGSDKAV
jgi:DNA polymerase (family 10)